MLNDNRKILNLILFILFVAATLVMIGIYIDFDLAMLSAVILFLFFVGVL